MLIPRRAVYTLIAGVHAAASVGRIPQPGGLNEPGTRQPATLPGGSASFQHDVRDSEGSRDVSIEDSERRFSGTQDYRLDKRQAAPVRAPTVFSTQTVTSTITTYAGVPFTSTVFVTLTSTVTLMGPTKRQMPETIIVAAPPGLPKRTTPWADSRVMSTFYPLIEMELYPNKAVPTLNGPSKNTGQEKRETKPATVTSVILIVSQTMVTVAPTVLVTSAVTVLSTITATAPISTVTSTTASSFTGFDGSSTAFLSSSVGPLPKTSSASSPSSPSSTSSASTAATSALTNGAIGGIAFVSVCGAAFLLALLFCCRRRKRKNQKTSTQHNRSCFSTLTSTSSLGTSEAAEQGAVTHREIFGIGTSPAASVASSIVQARQPQPQQQPLTTAAAAATPTRSMGSGDTRIVVRSPSSNMAQTLSTGGSRAVGRTFASSLWRPGAMAFSHSSGPRAVAGTSRLVGSDDNDNSSSNNNTNNDGDGNEESSISSGFNSNEAQPPSPVASSGIFGPYSPSTSLGARSSLWQPLRDTWASSAVMSISSMQDSSMMHSTRQSHELGGRLETTGQGEEAEAGAGSWIPSFPEPGRGRTTDERQGRAGWFDESRAVLSKRNGNGSESGSGSGSVDGRTAFL